MLCAGFHLSLCFATKFVRRTTLNGASQNCVLTARPLLHKNGAESTVRNVVGGKFDQVVSEVEGGLRSSHRGGIKTTSA